MPDFPRYDWNAVAAGVQMLPDEAIRLALQSAPNLDALFKAWEGVWKQVSVADATLQGKMLCEILLGFYRAEALRREITEPK